MSQPDPFFNWILGLTAAGLTSTAVSISGSLHTSETFHLGSVQLAYPAATRKLPLAVLGFGFCYAAWLKTQERQEWQRQYVRWQRHQDQLQAQQQALAAQEQAITAQARLQAWQQVAQLQAAEEVYPQLAPYLEPMQACLETTQPQAQSISAPGEAVPPPQPQSQPPMPAAAGSASSPPLQGPGGPIQLRDFTPDLAQYDGHILGASRTRSGKTTTLQTMIRHRYNRHNGNVGFHIFDPKGAAWCGLEHDANRYLFCNSPRTIPAVIQRLGAIIDRLEGRQHDRMFRLGGHYTPGTEPRPEIVMIEEFNTLLSLAKKYDRSFPPKDNPRTQIELQGLIERLIFQGAEDRIYVWLMAQTTRVENLGLNTSVQDNMTYFALARNGDYQSVEDAINNPYVVTSTSERKELQALLSAYRYDTTQDLTLPIAFTTLGGNQMCKLPNLSGAKDYVIPGLERSGTATTPIVTPPLANCSPPPPPDLPLTERERLEFLLNNSPGFSSQIPTNSALTEAAQLLFNYLSMRDGMTTRAIKKNWGANNGYAAAQVEQLLSELLAHDRVTREIRQTPDAHIWRAKTGHGQA